MNKKFLESSEFYSTRFHNFSTLIIVPITCLLVGVVLFSLIGKREIIINGTGDINPQKMAPVIQATVNSSIKRNYLVEGKLVHKGQKLLVYTNVFNNNKLHEDRVSKKQIERQIVALSTLKDSIDTDKDSFNKDDEFGYREQFQSYLKQRQVYLTENEMLEKKFSTTRTGKKDLTATAKQVVAQDKTNLQAYRSLYRAIRNGTRYDSHAKYAYVYQEYRVKLKETRNGANKKLLKASTLGDIQQQIDTLQDSVSSAKIQVTQIDEFDDTKYSKATNKEKLMSLKNDQLNENAGSLIKAKRNLREVKADMRSLTDESKDYTIKSPKKGVVHVISQYKGAKYVSSGSDMAQIFPILSEQKNVKVRMYISTMDISSIKLKQAIRFKVTRNVPRPIILNGQVAQIGVSPADMNNGSFYEVVANVPVDTAQRKLLRYGMNGNASIITGKTTWFTYYKNKLLNGK